MSFNERELKNLFNRIGGAMLMFLLAFNLLCGGAYSIGESLLAVSHDVSTKILVELLNSIAYIAAYSIPVWFFLLLSKDKNVQPFGLSVALSKDRPALVSVAMMFLGTAACFCASYVNSLLFPVSESASDLYFFNEAQAPYVLILMFISSAIVPAFVEELLFRGMILSSVRPYSESGAILISAILFGLMHQTPFQLFYTTVIGVILGVVRVKTGSIWVGVLVHFFNNLFSTIQSYLLGCFDEQTGSVVYATITLITMAVGGILGAVLYVKSLAQNERKDVVSLGFYGKSEKFSSHLSFGKEARCVYKAFFAPALLLYVIFCGLTIISTAALIWSA